MTERWKAIAQIEGSYPPDASAPDVRAVGQSIMQRAREENDIDWRDEPDAVLIRAAELCNQIDNTLGVKL